MRPRHYMVLGTIAIALMLGLAARGTATRTRPPMVEPVAAPVTRQLTAVLIKGELAGYVEDATEVEAALATVKSQVPADVQPYVKLQEGLAVQPALVTGHVAPLATAALVDRLMALVPQVHKGYAIRVNGRDIVGVADEETAKQVVKEIQDDYKTVILKESATVEQLRFLETIDFREKWLLQENVRLKDVAKDILRYGTDKRIFHTVQRGDTLWQIATDRGLDVEAVLKANPGVDPQALQPGQQISMTVKEPYVHVESTEVQTYTEAIQFPEEVGEDPDLWPWQHKVLVGGAYGKRQVTVRIYRQDGREVKRETLDVKVLSSPTKQVSVRGTRQAPKLGTGVFYWPVQGELTSYYGPRWGSWHPGIDIAAKTGTPVLAADSGTVVMAQWNGNYGLCILIDHGGGKIVTLYGHLSGFNVSVGDQVQKGAVIGYVGNTGYSTGPHLHFEVQIDGRTVNPLNFYP